MTIDGNTAMRTSTSLVAAPINHSTDLPPVVLVHGIFRTRRDMRRLRAAFEAAGRRTFAPDLRPCHGSASINELAAKLGAYIEENLGPGGSCDIVGHSMGGLVARTYVQRHGGLARVRRLVTLAAPHHGSLLAWLVPGRGPRDMRPGSEFLRDLALDVHTLDAVRVTSYWTPFDLVVVPAKSSLLPVGKNLRLTLPHHRAFLFNAKLAREIVASLSEEEMISKF